MTARRPKLHSLDELSETPQPTAVGPTETEAEVRARREAARGDPGRSRADLEERQRRWLAERERIEHRRRPGPAADPASEPKTEPARTAE